MSFSLTLSLSFCVDLSSASVRLLAVLFHHLMSDIDFFSLQ